jgi:hypothetical protein
MFVLLSSSSRISSDPLAFSGSLFSTCMLACAVLPGLTTVAGGWLSMAAGVLHTAIAAAAALGEESGVWRQARAWSASQRVSRWRRADQASRWYEAMRRRTGGEVEEDVEDSEGPAARSPGTLSLYGQMTGLKSGERSTERIGGVRSRCKQEL